MSDANEKVEDTNEEPIAVKPSLHSRIWTFVKDPKHSNALIAFFTVLIMLTGVIYTLFAGLQWSVMKESNEINRDSLVSVQRGFLVCQDLTSQRSTVRDSSTKGFHVTWNLMMPCENAGSTPANVIAESVSGDILPSEPTEERFIQTSVVTSRNVIGPRASQNMQNVSIRELSLIGSEFAPGEIVNMTLMPPVTLTKGYFIWGWISYYDVFAPKTKLHITEFCRELINIGIDRSNPVTPRFQSVDQACGHHNCADEYCEDYQQIVARSK